MSYFVYFIHFYITIYKYEKCEKIIMLKYAIVHTTD